MGVPPVPRTTAGLQRAVEPNGAFTTASSLVFACHSKACAPPPVGKGGSTPGVGAVKSALKALRDPDGGFTIAVPKMRSVNEGIAVALDGTDRLRVAADSFDSRGRPKAALVNMVVDRINAAMSTNLPRGTQPALGGWHNPADGKLEINVTAVFPPGQRARAIRFGREQNQISILDLGSFEFIDTGGTGGERKAA
jgi:hypothetical protein